NHAKPRHTGAQPCALPVYEKEGLALLNRPPQGQSILVPAELRLAPRLSKEIPGVQILVAKEFEHASVEVIASGFPDHHYCAAVRPAVLRRIGVDVEFELFHAVDDGVVDHLARFGL